MQWTGTGSRGLSPRFRKRKMRGRDECGGAMCVQRENCPTVPLIGGRAPDMHTSWSPLYPAIRSPLRCACIWRTPGQTAGQRHITLIR